jgi:hypothetical protein
MSCLLLKHETSSLANCHYVHSLDLQKIPFNYSASFEAFMVVIFQVEVFWVVTPCSVVRYKGSKLPPSSG